MQNTSRTFMDLEQVTLNQTTNGNDMLFHLTSHTWKCLAVISDGWWINIYQFSNASCAEPCRLQVETWTCVFRRIITVVYYYTRWIPEKSGERLLECLSLCNIISAPLPHHPLPLSPSLPLSVSYRGHTGPVMSCGSALSAAVVAGHT